MVSWRIAPGGNIPINILENVKKRKVMRRRESNLGSQTMLIATVA